jgi:hypothetical protein
MTKLNDDIRIKLLQILDNNGLDDALLALQPCDYPTRFDHLQACGADWFDRLKACDATKVARLLACDYAEHVLPLFEAWDPDDKRPRRAIEVARRYTDGLATADELDAAKNAAKDAVIIADWDASRTAAWAAAWAGNEDTGEALYIAAKFARDAAGEAEKDWQEEHLRKLLND